MGVTWLWVMAACALASANGDRGGSSLRGALEALQRRQRGRVHSPLVTQTDYDALYEFVPPQGYPELDYPVDIEDIEEEPNPKYIIKLLEDEERSPDTYEYRVIKKKNLRSASEKSNSKKESAFRERSHHSDNERLRDLFVAKNEEEKKEIDDRAQNDAEYALLLGQLWSKYKYNKVHSNNLEQAPQGVVKLYKEKVVKKRYPDNWGPIAFKRKRSSDSDMDHDITPDFKGRKHGDILNDPTYNAYEVADDDKDDLREEYAIAFQPLDDDTVNGDEDQYVYDTVEKRFPVTKRSSGPYNFGTQKKRFVLNQDKNDKTKSFRSSSGTDPRIIKDLSKIFGDPDTEVVKNPVKRSSDNVDSSHESKPPKLATIHHNHTHEHSNSSKHDEISNEHHEHSMHHPRISGKEEEIIHYRDHNEHGESHKPINIKKKSIDWSDYFGIDKRNKNHQVSFINDLTQERLGKQYFDTFNKEVIYPLNGFRQHNNVKRNFVQPKINEESEIIKARGASLADDKRNTASENDAKLDNIDRKLKTMEGLIVDEALHYSEVGEELDSKEEQAMKEKLLSELAAAYSLEKMRKALKEFQQSLQAQKAESLHRSSSPMPNDEAKSKRVAVKKEKVEINDIPIFDKAVERNEDFEDEQGAGHYLNGKVEEQFSEGYMGGSGRHRSPVISTARATGSCPVLGKIIQRCQGVDFLAGDRGQLFLPLCSLHQICYLCGEAPPTTCDLVFLSEADTACEGDMGCQRAARSALMALRELHDSLADELDGECEASPCLPATLKLNLGWQRALQR
ncbi:unnamed protein product [Diatraea saccharalis]|uniref:Uncharacterized protein n=1 Tax=Diatraea saccharalis TaxID=40085 RepID=A0A9N9RHK6_9NEOP|nr:unnamed protein product [Diatraea saccharalis]